ncbi:MAG: hypothetical protein PWR01_3541, partial [Clostridiales bacterium]|nr:hypothetical protein [Clostridiales bacterium]MDN5282468.1 hypothetical protein [Candidatus Ozemobacter sp.]
MKNLTRTILIFSIVASLTLCGCDFFSSGGETNSSTAKSNPTMLFSGNTSTSADVEFSNSDFSFKLESSALNSPRPITIQSFQHTSKPFWEKDFSVLSLSYDISLGNAPVLLKTPAKLSFSNSIAFPESEIFALAHSSTEGWRIFSPEPFTSAGRSDFYTSQLSTWYLARRVKQVAESPLRSPDLILSPEVLLLSPQGYFSKDLKISSSFRIATSTTLFPDRYGFRLKLHADTAFSIDLSSETDGTVT